jgi:hypothetical protein
MLTRRRNVTLTSTTNDQTEGCLLEPIHVPMISQGITRRAKNHIQILLLAHSKYSCCSLQELPNCWWQRHITTADNTWRNWRMDPPHSLMWPKENYAFSCFYITNEIWDRLTVYGQSWSNPVNHSNQWEGSRSSYSRNFSRVHTF